jgi:hypothetical protein
VAAFYELPVAPPPASPADTILVVQADGTGVPMVQPPPMPSPVRLGKGQKRTKKKEAVVTALDTIAPYHRTPQEVVAALLDDEHPTSAARPVPVGKELRATLEGKAVAMAHLGRRVAQREGPHLQPRVALTDGAEALPQQVVPRPGVHLGTGHQPGRSVAVGCGQCPAGGDPSTAPGVGPCLPGGVAGRTDRRRHHGVGGRGEGPHVDGAPTAGGAADRGLLPTESAVQARRRRSGARLADGDGRGGRGLWARGEGPPGAVGDALDHRGRAGGARPADGAAQRALGGVWAVSSATATSAVIRHVCPSTGYAGRSGTNVGGGIKPLSTDFGHTQITIDGSEANAAAIRSYNA